MKLLSARRQQISGQMTQAILGRCHRRRETGLQEIAAGWRLPVKHFAYHIGARHLAELEVLVHFFPRSTQVWKTWVAQTNGPPQAPPSA